jgi:hypothetical protein
MLDIEELDDLIDLTPTKEISNIITQMAVHVTQLLDQNSGGGYCFNVTPLSDPITDRNLRDQIGDEKMESLVETRSLQWKDPELKNLMMI